MRYPTRVIEREIKEHEAPYAHLVPKDFYANLEFRKAMIRLGSANFEGAENLWVMCSRDILFYINTFIWTHDPRTPIKELPFITYPFQDEAILEIKRCVEQGEDLPIEKTRDMGATWMVLMVFQWFWQFKDFNNFLIVSRNQDLVDKSGSPDTLFWKLDHMLKRQPGWLRPAFSRKQLHLLNEDTGSVIDGESTTGDVGRGGRYTAMMLDEFASVTEGASVLSSSRDATKCRIINSTPKGKANAFYRFIAKARNKLTLHWTLHPIKAKGVTYGEDGRPTSPWYENEKARASHPMEIAQELDIDYLGSDYLFFAGKKFEEIKNRDCRMPLLRGDLDFNRTTCRPEMDAFVSRDKGPLSLWILPLQDGSIPKGRYALGVDISVGTGSSNSVISVGDRDTGQKVAEYVNSHIAPHELAKVAVAMARWFAGPSGPGFMAWEGNGPGLIFGECVIETGYRNFYYRRDRTTMRKKISDKPGWWSTKETKMTMLGELRRALTSGDYVQRSRESFDECEAYVFTSGGKVMHSSSIANPDPTDTEDNHGDRVIADGLSWMVMQSNVKSVMEDKVPEYGFAARFNARRKAERIAAQEEVLWAV